MFFTLFGCFFWGGGGLPRGLGHNLLMQFYTLCSSNLVVPLGLKPRALEIHTYVCGVLSVMIASLAANMATNFKPSLGSPWK